MLEEQKEQMKSTRAFDWVSFDPEKRMDTFIREYEQEDQRMLELANKYNMEFSRFREKHFALAMEYLHSQSRCISWAISGPANFPVARQQKRQGSCEAHLNKLIDFRGNFEKLLKRINRRTETQDDKKARWIKQVELLKARQEMMKTANALLRKKDIPALIELVGKQAAEVLQKPDFCGRVGFAGYQLSNNLANIKRLEQQIAQIDSVRENKAETGFDFDGGRVEFDAEEIRYNIFFDSIPQAEMRSKLKSYGFKWSPRRGAWTRGAKTIRIDTIKDILGGQ